MSKNDALLNESQIRKFMKLANLTPLTPGFIHGLSGVQTESHGRGKREGAAGDEHPDQNSRLEEEHGTLYRDEDEELEAELGATEDELGDEDALADEEGDELAGLGDELDMEAGPTVSVDDFLAALEIALEDVLGDEVDVEQEDEEEDLEIEDDFGAEEADLDLEDEVVGLQEEEGSKKGEFKRRGKSKKHPVGRKAGDVGGHYKADEMDEAAQDTRLQEIIDTVTKRVAKRIVKEALARK